ncbi:hypothetical protein DL98DRAFT_581133 [Cadophora sp. DSE1049]|nr:hypothetical protein DL98DRAFT_581133 [Cadophora sp. DSE1049]
MTDSNITSRLRKLRFGRRVSPTRSVPTPSKASSVSSQKSKTQLAKIDIYHPLSPSTREIRLLHILPEQPGSLLLGPDPISCVLSHVSLDDKPTYHALSYTWDDESLGQSFEDPDDVKRKRRVLISGFIFLDGQAVEVTPNLWVALWHLRRGANWFKEHPDAEAGEFGEMLDRENPTHFTYETPLWIDALCINQLDVLERNQQVQMMGSIYKSGQAVHSWTGLDIPDTGLFIDMVQDFHERFGGSDDAKVEVRKMLLNDDLQASWKPLPSIARRPYWDRLWIVQEYLLGLQCVVHIGLRLISATHLTWVTRELLRSQAVIGSSEWTTIDRETPISHTLQSRHSAFSYPNLSEVLSIFRKHKCSDPRDKIYGLLGLSGRSADGIRVDYTLDADTVYLDAIRHMILNDQDLRLVFNPGRYSCHCPESQHTQSSLPTWVPDLRCLNDAPSALIVDHSWKPTGNKIPRMSASTHNNVLRCHGLLLGTINIIHTVNDTSANFSSSKSVQVRNLANFAATAAPAHDSTAPASKSPQTQLQRFKALYSALTPNKNIHYNATLDETTFTDFCTNAISQDPQLDDDISSRVLNMAPFAAVFSLRLARLSSSATDSNIPSGPVFGLCYPFCQDGDIIAALHGCAEMAVLRPDPVDPGRFKVMCEAYVHGFMDGEGLGLLEEREFELT